MRRKIKNTIIKATSFMAIGIVLIGGMCVDSETMIPTIAVLISSAYLCLVAIANK